MGSAQGRISNPEPARSDLCQGCAIRKLSEEGDHDSFGAVTVKGMRRSGDSGCHVCRAISNGIHLWAVHQHILYDDGDIDWLQRSTLEQWNPRHLRIQFKSADGLLVLATELVLYAHPEKGLPKSFFGVASTVSPRSDSKETFQLAKKWLETCLEGHAGCRALRELSYPARLIDIGVSALNDEVKLVNFPALPVSYVALSYSWGSGNPLKTEKATLALRHRRIEWSLLPKGFQDAISICRHLDQRYLWIDALCIIQNDKRDWEKESAKMADIYEAAYVTISAAWAPDCTGGYFHNRSYHEDRENLDGTTNLVGDDAITFEYCFPGGLLETVCVCRAFEHETVSTLVMKESPLYYRAWALQERLFSPRILQYTQSELCWECRTCVECECRGINAHNISSRNGDAKIDRNQRLIEILNQTQRALRDELDTYKFLVPGSPISPGPVVSNRTNSLKSWRALVTAYSQRNLTFQTDKLPAFSGIAKRFIMPELGQYCAGIWEAELPIGLLWAQFDLHGPKRCHTPYRAPTWSWASVQGHTQLGYPFDPLKAFVEADVKDVYCQLASVNSTGQISGAHIILHAPVIKAGFRFRPDIKSGWYEATSPAPSAMNQYAGGWSGLAMIDGDVAMFDRLSIIYDIEASLAIRAHHSDPDLRSKAVFVWYSQAKVESETDPNTVPESCFLAIVTSHHHESLTVSNKLSERIESADGFHALILVESKYGQGTYERIGKVHFERMDDQRALALGEVATMSTVSIV